MAKVNEPHIVNTTIQSYCGKDGSCFLQDDDPFARPAMFAYITAMRESGKYVALTELAVSAYIERYGRFEP